MDPNLAIKDLEAFLKDNYRQIMPKYTFDARLNHMYCLRQGEYNFENKADKLF